MLARGAHLIPMPASQFVLLPQSSPVVSAIQAAEECYSNKGGFKDPCAPFPTRNRKSHLQSAFINALPLL